MRLTRSRLIDLLNEGGEFIIMPRYVWEEIVDEAGMPHLLPRKLYKHKQIHRTVHLQRRNNAAITKNRMKRFTCRETFRERVQALAAPKIKGTHTVDGRTFTAQGTALARYLVERNPALFAGKENKLRWLWIGRQIPRSITEREAIAAALDSTVEELFYGV